jgi:AcrR family transcriptional regulator
VFGEAGYEAASIEQIAQRAEVARGTFYLYFPDKLALFQDLMERFFGPMQEVFAETTAALAASTDGPSVSAAYQAMASQIAIIGLGQHEEILVAFREVRQPGPAGEWLRARERALIDQAVAFTEDVASRGLLSVTHPRVACLVVYGAVERLFYEVLTGHDLGDPGTLATDVLGLFGQAMGFPTTAD